MKNNIFCQIGKQKKRKPPEHRVRYLQNDYYISVPRDLADALDSILGYKTDGHRGVFRKSELRPGLAEVLREAGFRVVDWGLVVALAGSVKRVDEVRA